MPKMPKIAKNKPVAFYLPMQRRRRRHPILWLAPCQLNRGNDP